MPNYSESRLRRLYLAVQSTFNTAATLTGANACKFISAAFTNKVGIVTRKDINGTRTAVMGTEGRVYVEWQAELSFAPNGAPGVVPDCDPILQCAFGGAATVLGSTTTKTITSSTNASPIALTVTGHGYTVATYVPLSVVGHAVNTNANGMQLAYVTDANTLTLQGTVGNGIGAATGTVNLHCVEYTIQEPVLPTFTAGHYRTPTSLSQEIAIGCTTKSIEFSLGENDGVGMKASGEALYAIDSFYFPTAPTDRTGGMSSFPAEPSTPVYNGGIFAGFTGAMTIGGNPIVTARTATVTFDNASEVVKDLFGSFVPDSVEADVRKVTVALSLYDADDAASQALIIAGQTKTPIDVILKGGTVQGNCMFFRLHNVLLETAALEAGQIRMTRSVAASQAYGSQTGLDEITMWVA